MVGPRDHRTRHSKEEQRGRFSEVEFVDLREVNLPFMDEPHHPRLNQYTHQHTIDCSATVAEADAFVYKPVGLVSNGGISAGTRAAQMIKQDVTTVKMTPVAEAVAMPLVAQFLDEKRNFVPNPAMSTSAKAMFDELVRVSTALRPLRDT